MFSDAPTRRYAPGEQNRLRRCLIADPHAAGSQCEPVPHVAAVCDAAQAAVWWRARERLSGVDGGDHGGDGPLCPDLLPVP
jgi:hypothetical protein